MKNEKYEVGDLVQWKWDRDSSSAKVEIKEPMGIIIKKYYFGGNDYVNIFWIDYKYILPERTLNPRLKKVE